MRLRIWTTLFSLTLAQFAWGQTSESPKLASLEVTAHTPAVKYATELCEVLGKTDKTICPSLFRDPDRLLSSQWIWGDGEFF